MTLASAGRNDASGAPDWQVRVRGWKEFVKAGLSITNRARMSVALDRISRHWCIRSYSQFGEDAYVFSYFRGRDNPMGGGNPSRSGFYVDIGAYSPFDCSNTKLFHAHGWTGINVDPTPGVMDAFRVARPAAVNLAVAVGSEPGEMTFYSFGSPCVFNTASEEVAREAQKTLGYAPTRIPVRVMRLEEILSRNPPPVTGFDFMTIDVEGMELEVLRSNDWLRFRPEILAVERHGSQVQEHVASPLAAFLRDSGYELLAWLNPTLVFRDTRRRVR